ncbi:hypothetical protein HK101_004749, partial [Irineochytrium annulatum]
MSWQDGRPPIAPGDPASIQRIRPRTSAEALSMVGRPPPIAPPDQAPQPRRTSGSPASTAWHGQGHAHGQSNGYASGSVEPKDPGPIEPVSGSGSINNPNKTPKCALCKRTDVECTYVRRFVTPSLIRRKQAGARETEINATVAKSLQKRVDELEST